jgi:hypothetical protein
MFVEGGGFELLILATMSGALVYYLYLVKAGKSLPELRDFAAINAISDGIDRCLETGKNVVFTPGGVSDLRGQFSPMTIAAMNFQRYIARMCYRKGARLVSLSGSNPDCLPMQDMILREAAALEGHPEAYNRDTDLLFFAQAYDIGFGSTIERENIGVTIQIGVGSGNEEEGLENSVRRGSINIIGGLRWIMYCCYAFTADYMLISDEVYAGAAKVSGNREAIAIQASSDIPKLLVIGIMILFLILGFAGLPVEEWLSL